MTYNYFIEVYDFPRKRRVWFRGYPPNSTITGDDGPEPVAIFKVKWKNDLPHTVILDRRVRLMGMPGVRQVYY